ncbi:MAG: sulfotransferase [Gammaproteobacteria bacterium]|nr:sulfotransferase [Gammaproteobacteria bacterium]
MELNATIDREEAKKLQPRLEQGIRLQRQGELGKAAQIYQEILNRIPDHPDALHLLGTIMYKCSNYAIAASMIKKAINIAPKVPQYHNSMGKVLVKLGQHDQSIKYYENALDIDPDYIDAQDNLLLLMRWSNKPEGIVERFKKYADSNNNNPLAYLSLAIACQRQGRFDEAVLNFEKSISHDQNCFQAYIGYTSCKKITEEDKNLIYRMMKLANSDFLSDSNRSKLLFSIGKAYDDIGDFDTAFINYDKANKIRRTTFDGSFNRADSSLYFARLKSAFTKEIIDRANGAGNDSIRPVFITGLSRTGKTLIEQVLAKHGKVFGAGELSYIQDITKTLPSHLQTSRSYPRCISRINNDVLHKLADKYLGLIDNIPPEYTRVIDSMGANFLHIGLINMMFRKAKIIHCYRNALDTCLLLYFTDFDTYKFHRYAFDLSDIGFYYQQYNDLMEHWRNILPNKFLEISYEDHMAKQTSMLKCLIDYCGLDWDLNCSKFCNTEQLIMNSGFWQVRQEIYQPSIDKWKNYEKYLQPLKDALQI